MQLRRNHRQLALVVAFGVGSAGLALATPARAQEPAQPTQTGGRMRILVPALEHPANVDGGFGKTVADRLRAAIDKLPTHTAVPQNEIKDNLKKYKIDEKTLDCIKSRQLAVQINSELVMCGNYEPQAGGGMKVTAQFIGAKTGETFEVPAITATTPDDAASKIFTAFEAYVSQLRAAAICQQYLQSQQWASALSNCNTALQVNPNSSTALYGKSRALMEMDSLPQAMAALQGVIKSNPMHQDALRAAGVLAAKMGNYQQSLDYFNQYLELNPGDVSVRLNIANDAAKAGNYEGAVKIVEQGFKADSASPQLLQYAATWALQGSQKLQKDAEEKDKPVPAKADSLALVGLGYYQKLLAVQDTAVDPAVLRNVVLIMASHKQGPQGAQVATKYLATPKFHGDAGLWSAYADALNAAGQSTQALAALDTAATLDTKGDYPIYAKRGQWLAEKGQVAAATDALQQAVAKGKVKADDAANLMFGVGFNKYRDKDYDTALKYFSAVRQLAGTAKTRGMASFWTGTIYFQRGSAAAQANPKKASPAAAALFRQAQEQFNSAGAYLSDTPSAARQVEQWSAYIKSYLDAVKKAGAGE